MDYDIRKPIKSRNTLMLTLTDFIEMEKYYKIRKIDDKIIITELKEAEDYSEDIKKIENDSNQHELRTVNNK